MPSFGTLKADTLTHSTAGSLATNFVVEGSSKAWANFDGDASGIPIRDSFNVSGNTDNGTGDYTITFTNSMANVGYCIAGAGEAGGGGSPMCLAVNGTDGLLTGSARMYTKTASPADSNVVSVMAQGNLA
tara:strand:- start:57 stop:446 length:390 start_codon:yes stop_codon:yes gene_type:complete